MVDRYAEAKIFNLRNNPLDTIINDNFFVEINGLQINGGPIKIEGCSNRLATPLNITTCAINDSCDFYFPYIQAQAGNVTIPENRLIEGTIVVTTGMNGCALEVRYRNDCYTFYHDANGIRMPNLSVGEVRVCRITSDDYWDDNYQILNLPNIQAYPIVQFVCVFRHSFWHVGAFGLYLVGNDFQSKTIVDTFCPKHGKYRGYFNENISEII